MAFFFSPTRSIVGTSLGTLYVRLTVDPQEMLNGMSSAERGLFNSTDAMARQLKSFAAAATTAFAAVAAVSISEFTKFDEALTKSLSLMDNFSDQMKERMGESALDLSRKTKQSATELAGSYYYLASAGYTAEQSLALLPTTTRFATASSMEAADAVNYLATSQSALGLTFKDSVQNMENMTRISDVLTKANQLSIATIEEYAKALSGSAGTMKIFDMSVEEGVAVLTAFAAQGIKGAQAGSAFAIVVRDMQRAAIQAPEVWRQLGISVYDASGNFRNMSDILKDFQKTFAGVSDEEKRQALLMMGLQDRSLRYTLALLGTSNSLKVYQDTLEKAAGTTQQVSDVQLTSFQNHLKMTRNNLQMVAIAIGKEMAPSLLALMQDLQKGAEWLLRMQREAGVLSATVKTVADVFKAFGLGLAVVWTTLRSIATVIADYLTVSALNLNTVIGGLIKLNQLWWDSIATGLIPALRELGSVAKDVGRLLVAVFLRDFEGIVEASKNLVNSSKSVLDGISSTLSKGTVEASKIVKDTIQEVANNTVEMGKGTVQDLKDQWTDLINLGDKLFPQIDEGSQHTVTSLNDVAEAATNATTRISDAAGAVEKTNTAVSNSIRQMLDSAELMKVLAEQGMGTVDEQGQMRPGSFEQGMGRFKSETRQIGEQAGLTDPFVSELEKYNEQIKETEASLKQLAELQAKDVQLTKDAQEKKAAAIAAYNQRLQTLHSAQSMSILRSSQNMFDSLAGAVEGFAGQQSGVYKAMFAASKAFAIAESIIKIQQGIANASALPWPANLAAIASVVAATANIVSTISSVTMSIQGRAAGGPVSAGVPFRVGERGQELFIPAQDGTIIPNDDLQGMGRRGTTVVNINNYTSSEVSVEERGEGNDKTIEIAIRQVKKDIAGEIRDGRGEVSKAMETSYRLRRGRQR